MPHPTEPIHAMSVRRVLVAIDGSPAAELALSAAMTAIEEHNAAITLLVVVPEVPHGAGWPGTGPGFDPQTLQREAQRDADELLHRTLDRLPADLPVTTRQRTGKPGPEICAEAGEGDYDAILLGARGIGRLGAVGGGSVSSYVLHHAKTTVIVVHPPREG
ncbi:MAG: universal stress protein [Solirubrobacteraceae bacterium]|nr:universal stress protein [Patulibacter sp.]